MGAISVKKLSLVKRLYYRNFYGAKKIAQEMSVSIDAVYYFMRRNNLKRRSFSEENQLRFNRKKPSFKPKSRLSIRDEKLKALGVALYLGEGGKSQNWIIDFSNSDPIIIKIFVKFLRDICGIRENKLRVLLYCYKNQNINELITFWNKITKISKSQFTKPYVRNDFNPNKENKMKFGLVHIRYSDKKLFSLISKWTSDYIDNFG